MMSSLKQQSLGLGQPTKLTRRRKLQGEMVCVAVTESMAVTDSEAWPGQWSAATPALLHAVRSGCQTRSADAVRGVPRPARSSAAASARGGISAQAGPGTGWSRAAGCRRPSSACTCARVSITAGWVDPSAAAFCANAIAPGCWRARWTSARLFNAATWSG